MFVGFLFIFIFIFWFSSIIFFHSLLWKIYPMPFEVLHWLGEIASLSAPSRYCRWRLLASKRENVWCKWKGLKNFVSAIARLVEMQKMTFFRFRNFLKYWICFLKLKMKISNRTYFLFSLKMKTENDESKQALILSAAWIDNYIWMDTLAKKILFFNV